MLNKVSIPFVVGIVLSLLRAFAPQLEMPVGFEDLINGVISGGIVIAMTVVGWFATESKAKIAQLKTKP